MFEQLIPILPSINYFGRKGSFFQFGGYETSQFPPAVETGFVDLCTPLRFDDLGFGILQWMDDMRSDAHFRDVETIQSDPKSDGGRKPPYMVRLPYQVAEHGHNYVVYLKSDLKT